MKTTRRAALLGAAVLAGRASAQTFPNRQIRIVVPYSPGGGADTTVRLLAPKLQEALGETVVVDNRPGAGGTIGYEYGIRAGGSVAFDDAFPDAFVATGCSSIVRVNGTRL